MNRGEDSSVIERSRSIRCRDGRMLKSILLCSSSLEESVPHNVVIVVGAMGVACRFYRSFALHIVQNYAASVILFDYRGIGISRMPLGPRGFREECARYDDWGYFDVDAVVCDTCVESPDARLSLVCHSVGGQILGLAPFWRDASIARRIERVVMLSSQIGWPGLWPWRERLYVLGLWYLAIPILTRIYGYFPSPLVGMGENLPKDVARLWSFYGRPPLYCLRPDAARSFEPSYDAVRSHLLLVSSADDCRFAPRLAVDGLCDFYKYAPRTRWHVTAAECGTEKIDHFDLFRPSSISLWNAILKWLQIPSKNLQDKQILPLLDTWDLEPGFIKTEYLRAKL